MINPRTFKWSQTRRFRQKKNSKAGKHPRLKFKDGELIATDQISLGFDYSSLNKGLVVTGMSGSGKSMGIANMLAILLFKRKIPQVLIDPQGGLIDTFFNWLSRLPAYMQKQVLKRVLYVDISGRSGYPMAWPLLSAQFDESPGEIAQRIVELIRTHDPGIENAPISGLGPLLGVGKRAFKILAALGCQITELEDFLENGEAWKPRLKQLAQEQPELLQDVDYLLNRYFKQKDKQEQKAGALLARISHLITEERNQAMFGSEDFGIDWNKVEREGMTVIFDFRGEVSSELRQFKMWLVYSSFKEFVARRGAGSNRKPVALYIDELPLLVNMTVGGERVFESELDYLLSGMARSHNIWPVFLLQELWQVTPKLQKTLLARGNLLIGSMSDMELAKELASRFYQVEMERIKHLQSVWMNNPFLGPFVVDQQPIFATTEEQIYEMAYTFLNQPGRHFLFHPAQPDGASSGLLLPLRMKELPPHRLPQEAKVNKIRQYLLQRDWQPTYQVLQAIEARKNTVLQLEEPVSRSQQSLEINTVFTGQSIPSNEVVIGNLQGYLTAEDYRGGYQNE